ncbi:MAG: hypothetical protein ACREKI_02225 [Gemmatimonadota bacterium]
MKAPLRFVLRSGLTCAALAACDDSTGTGGSTPLEFSALSAGDLHTCGLTADSLAY